MKFTLFLMVLLYGSGAFCQSPKKMNKELISEFEACYSIYLDSMKSIDNKTVNGSGVCFWMADYILPVFLSYSDNYSKLYTSTVNAYEKLDSLQRNPMNVIRRDELNYLAPVNFEEESKFIYMTSKTTFTYRDHFDGYNWTYIKKTGEQNRALSRTISAYKDYLNENLKKYELYKPTFGRIHSIYDSLKATYSLYRDNVRKLKDLYAQLNGMLEEKYKESFIVKSSDFNEIEELEGKDDLLKLYLEVNAAYPGGQQEMAKFLQKNMRYPQDALDMQIGGKVHLIFTINTKGKLTNLHIARGVEDCAECNEEALRVVKLMPDWEPATFKGQYVNQRYHLPIKFNPG